MNSEQPYQQELRWDLRLLPPASEGWREVIFSVCPHLRGMGGGYPISGLGGGGYPISGLGRGYPIPGPGGGGPHPRSGGVPHPMSGGGTLGTPPRIASTCYSYAAGGMPLAFTQEDFLVLMFLHMKDLCIKIFITSWDEGMQYNTVSWSRWNNLTSSLPSPPPSLYWASLAEAWALDRDPKYNRNPRGIIYLQNIVLLISVQQFFKR